MDITQGAVAAAPPEAPGERVMDLLEDHVPLSLLMDLTVPAGPNSQEILEAEGSPEQHWWEKP